MLGRDQRAGESLQAEGWAMLSAVVSDFVATESCTVSTLVESQFANRLQPMADCHLAADAPQRDRLLDKLVLEADEVVLIAPEFEGVLLGLASRVLQLGGKLLSPDPDFIKIASDKQSTIERLHQASVATPRGMVVMPQERCPSGIAYPAVLKPLDGCGSEGVQQVDLREVVPSESGAYRLEELVLGTPVSVAILCDGQNLLPLAPCLQQLSDAGDFDYCGGETPIEPSLAVRASSLAVAAVRAMPPTTGYVGVDMVLGADDHASQDYVLEINPRYTTSYVGLRAAGDTNLAHCLLQYLEGRRGDVPVFSRSVSWNVAGDVCLMQEN